MPKISVLIAAFNRKNTTLICLERLFDSAGGVFDIDVFLVDDASTDGTAAAVAERFPSVRIIPGNGRLFWNRGMLRAWEEAEKHATDYFLWLNDDTHLLPGALASMVALAEAAPEPTILVGRIVDPDTGRTTYGGIAERRKTRRILGMAIGSNYFEVLDDAAAPCQTFHGNCVLVPHAVYARIGKNDGVYWHSDGDTDYGLRATRAGFRILQSPDPVAYGAFNETLDAVRQMKITPATWRKVLTNPKGRRPAETFHYYRSHIYPLWFVKWVWSYVKLARLS